MDLFRLFLFLLVIEISFSVHFDDFYQWDAPKRERNDIYCPVYCQDEFLTVVNDLSEVDCCNCRAKALWELMQNETFSLQIEYISRRGIAKILPLADKWTFLILKHNMAELRKIPINKCNFPSIVKIDLSGNSITEVGNITCLKNLDTLLLSNNNIRSISNDTFAGLTHLRKIDLSHNEIISMDHHSLSRPELGLFNVNLNNNYLEEIDVSNFVIDKSFCQIRFEENRITKLVNKGNFSLDTNVTYGQGGFVSLKNNRFETFPDFNTLGITDLTLLGKLLHFGFDMRGLYWSCDAHMVPYLNLSMTVMRIYWKDYMNIICQKPPRFKSVEVKQLLADKKLDEFISRLTHDEDCPFKCTCIAQPSQHKTMVNCSNAKLHSLPMVMPQGDFLELDLSHNEIQSVRFHKYLSRTKRLDLSNNIITHITNEALESLPKNGMYLDLRNNTNFRSLNMNFERMKRCDVRFGNKEIDCKCKDTWLPDWLSSETCSWTINEEELTCNTKMGKVKAEELKKDMVCVHDNFLYRLLTIIFSAIILIAVGLFSIFYKFRYEIAILFKRYKKWDRITMANYKFDGYISLHESSLELRQWTLRKLIPELTMSGYRIYCPVQHAEFGRSIDEEVIEKMNASRNIIVMLSMEYVVHDDGSCEADIRNSIEWRHAWNLFRKNKRLRLILINFDQMRTLDADNLQVRAFLRLQKTLDFSNRNHSLVEDIETLLGKPYRQTGLKNGKPKFYNYDLVRNIKKGQKLKKKDVLKD
ncbi:hypothetical protein FSP39_004558 [Pinctada imbricata]|uniref:TIR domain-containing protein n=1 Tax=Pinctada imbricata TaxID=66713 RepID=A0AA88XH82_PINIB|nr:hypothetical protein FSP39_004558 [Pinctada imbricata]